MQKSAVILAVLIGTLPVTISGSIPLIFHYLYPMGKIALGTATSTYAYQGWKEWYQKVKKINSELPPSRYSDFNWQTVKNLFSLFLDIPTGLRTTGSLIRSTLPLTTFSLWLIYSGIKDLRRP